MNKTEMTINTTAAPIVAPADETLKFRFTTDENVVETDFGKRWMGAAPMASDGRFIYTLVLYREGDANSTKKSTYCEVYSLEKKVIKFVREIRLSDET